MCESGNFTRPPVDAGMAGNIGSNSKRSYNINDIILFVPEFSSPMSRDEKVDTVIRFIPWKVRVDELYTVACAVLGPDCDDGEEYMLTWAVVDELLTTGKADYATSTLDMIPRFQKMGDG